MNVRTTLTSAALALVVAGSALAPNVQAETITPKVAEAVPNAVDEVSGIRVPDSKMARDAAQVIRDTEGDLLSTRCAFIIGLPWQESARD